jgi:hypothetical protein
MGKNKPVQIGECLNVSCRRPCFLPVDLRDGVETSWHKNNPSHQHSTPDVSGQARRDLETVFGKTVACPSSGSNTGSKRVIIHIYDTYRQAYYSYNVRTIRGM